MKPRINPFGVRDARVPYVWVLAPLIVLVLVAVVAWTSPWDSSEPGTAAGVEDTREPPDGTPAATASKNAAKQVSEKVATTTPDPTEAAVHPKLDRSMRRFVAAQTRLATRVGRQMKQRENQLAKRSQPVSFRVASYNVLGDSHTGPGGNKPGFPDGGPRMDMAISALRNNGIDVVGFQEFESSQYAMFTSRAAEYSLYPGLSLGDKSVRFNIAWRSSMWRLVEGRSISIPYAGGSRIEMPVVLLESTLNGRRAWFANFHNPADTPNLGNNARWRAEAAGIEVSYLTALHLEDGLPVIATGDYNERAEIFCRFTAGGVFSAAAGGSSAGGCAPPASMQVDWIFGSTGVAFDSYAVTNTGNASDHNLVHSGVTLLGDE
ncbi:MAG: endonuclease/exonuclease/phosphatase family protein [Nocardioides sp.]|nr:endonuclease/exonuclease/phosphatase family protein [Nocardioides sp.]